LLDWETQNIDAYLKEGISHYVDKINSSNDEDKLPRLNEKELAIGSFRYFRRSVLYELNALVEHWLLTFSSDIEDGTYFDNDNLKRTRSQSIKIIREKYSIDFSLIPGNQNVEKLKGIVNSLKHRGGYDFTDFSKSIPEIRFAIEDVNTLKTLLNDVIEFLKTILDKILDTLNKK
jgi:hypothetical protein